MVRRPIFILSVLLLGGALVQAALVTLSQNDATDDGGKVCTVCGPIGEEAPALQSRPLVGDRSSGQDTPR
jgi:hypothetical protein